MSKKTSVVISGVAGLSLVLNGAATVVPAMAVSSATGTSESGVEVVQGKASNEVKADKVVGKFTFDQAAVDSNETISKSLTTASKVLCGANNATDELSEETDADWAILVAGKVKESFTITEGELASNEFDQYTMKCICIGNPADGRAAVNATVSGITLKQVLMRAQPEERVNTIVFTSSDGYEVALPYKYVIQRKSLIVYEINGEGLDASVGGHNQLWLGATSARYFARDIVGVTLEQRETPPPAPGSEAAKDVFPNSPNVAVTGGE